MNPNEHSNYYQQTNSSVSFEHDVSHGNTQHELIKVKKESDVPLQPDDIKEKTIKFESIDNLEHGSS